MFVGVLANDFGVPKEQSLKAAQQHPDASNKDLTGQAITRAEQILRHTLVPLHSIFFDRVRLLTGGIKFIIDLRAELLTYIRDNEKDEYLSVLNNSLLQKLKAWMVGSLDLERITWNSPAVVLEKLIEYEAVHKIKDSNDLKRRVGPGRRFFGVFYRHIPQEPLTFIQVALCKELSGNVQRILNDRNPLDQITDPGDIKYAIFYSITSQPGLSGIELGSFLIKQVVIALQSEFPSIETFSTLSPIPGFRRWLNETLDSEGSKIFIYNEEDSVKTLVSNIEGYSANGDGVKRFKEVLNDHHLWIKSEANIKILRPILMRLCARYILTEKRNKLAIDPVANFHIRNGACVQRINWLGDTSEKGFDQSFGIMVNYNYVMPRLEDNNKQYLHYGTITISSEDPFLSKEAASSPASIAKA